jgi:hypothetical protein
MTEINLGCDLIRTYPGPNSGDPHIVDSLDGEEFEKLKKEY